jgi:hypothetical protein
MIGMEDLLRAHEAHEARAHYEYEQAYAEVLEEIRVYPELIRQELTDADFERLFSDPIPESLEEFMAMVHSIRERIVHRLALKRLED